MKDVIIFKVRPDEIDIFNKYADIYSLEVMLVEENLSQDTVMLCKGFKSVIIQSSCTIDKLVVKTLSEYGCNNIITRAIGYNNIDLEVCKKYGLNVSNVSYSPASVGEFTVMLMLMSIRKMKQNFINVNNSNPIFANLLGRELHELCIGIIGYGNIGKSVIKNLKGFGCEVIIYDHNPNKNFEVEYVDLESLYQRADIISLHIPLKPETYHFINEVNLKKMKDGVILINTSRGGLIDTKDLIKYLGNSKVGACALDTFENEISMFKEVKENIANDFSVLNNKSNVILSPHMAFFTETATDDCIRIAFENINKFVNGEKVSYSLID
jgi:D-lactate dehydrogenase